MPTKTVQCHDCQDTGVTGWSFPCDCAAAKKKATTAPSDTTNLTQEAKDTITLWIDEGYQKGKPFAAYWVAKTVFTNRGFDATQVAAHADSIVTARNTANSIAWYKANNRPLPSDLR